MSGTFQNSAMVLSIGIFFTLITIGLSGPRSLSRAGLTARGPRRDGGGLAHLPPTALFAALLGYNPMQTLLGPALATFRPPRRLPHRPLLLPRPDQRPVPDGLNVAFDFAIVACLVAAVASLLRGKRYVHDDLASAPAPAAPDSADPVAAAVRPAVTAASPAVTAAAAADRTPADVPAKVRVSIAEDAEESSERTLALRVPAVRFHRHPR